MGLHLEPDTGKIVYRGKVVGEHSLNDGRDRVTLNLEFEAGEDWMVPLSYFSWGLNKIDSTQQKQADLEISLKDTEVNEVEGAYVYLIEKTIKVRGYVWKFHKSDMDNWPSPLHAHEYDRNLKLDAITGKIYDVATKKHCKTVKSKKLKAIQESLCASSDFETKAKKYISGCQG